MNLPPFPDISTETLHTIAERHGLGGQIIVPMPQIGIVNRLFAIGEEVVLRIPREHPRIIAMTRKEAAIIPILRRVGVHTPAIVAFDDACDLLPVPYTLYERVHGMTLETPHHELSAKPQAWQAVGHELARLHAAVKATDIATEIIIGELSGPREFCADLARDGYFTGFEEEWFMRWLERLAPFALAPRPLCFIHSDVQGTNIMLRDGTLDDIVLLDWGDAGWGDSAYDFAGMTLAVVPFMLEGYRAVVTLVDDETTEARILWRHLQLALWLLRREPQPERSWAERPTGMLFDVLRFFLDKPQGRWGAFAP